MWVVQVARPMLWKIGVLCLPILDLICLSWKKLFKKNGGVQATLLRNGDIYSKHVRVITDQRKNRPYCSRTIQEFRQ